MANTYTNVNEAVGQMIYADAAIEQYSDATADAFEGNIDEGSYLGTFVQLAGTNTVAQDNGEANITWVDCTLSGESAFYVYGENLFKLNNGSYLSRSQATSPILPQGGGGGLPGGTGDTGGGGTGSGSGTGDGSGASSGSGGTSTGLSKYGVGEGVIGWLKDAIEALLGMKIGNIPLWLIAAAAFVILNQNGKKNDTAKNRQ